MKRKPLSSSTCLWIGVALGLFTQAPLSLAARSQATPAATPAQPSASRTVEIPEGTPVIVHLFGWNGAFSVGIDRVIQVDQDVVVNGIVVVPRGSVGISHFDRYVEGTYREDFGVQPVPHGLIGPKEKHLYGPKKHGSVQEIFTCFYVFSIASTQLDVDRSPNIFDVEHGNAHYGPYGITPDIDSEFTLKLRHAVVNLPPATPQ